MCSCAVTSTRVIRFLAGWLPIALLALRGAEPPPWRAGAAIVDLTPEGPLWLAGYGGRTRPSEGVAQHIFAKALALEDSAGAPLVVVTLDLVLVPRPLRQAVEKAAAERHQLPPAAILLNASHTHSAPAQYTYSVPDPVYARKAEEYGRYVQTKVIEVIAAALAHREPARVNYSHARAGFGMNRRLLVGKQYQNSRNPDGPVDTDVPVLRVTKADGKVLAVLFGYACHNTVSDFYQINGDYAGFAQAYLQEAHPGAVAMFVQGAAGDQNPYPRHVSLDQAAQHGRTLSNAVETALAGPQRPLRGPLRTAYGAADLPYATVTRAELEHRAKSKRGVEKDEAVKVLRELDAGGSLPTSFPCPVQAVSFGPELTLIAIGGEPTVEYSLRLKRELATERRAVWVAGYSNEGFGYLGSRKVILEGGYEGATANLGRHHAPWAPEAEERVVSRIHELVRSVQP